MINLSIDRSKLYIYIYIFRFELHRVIFSMEENLKNLRFEKKRGKEGGDWVKLTLRKKDSQGEDLAANSSRILLSASVFN